MKLIDKAGSVFDRVIDFFAFLAGTLIILIVATIAYTIVCRLFFHFPTLWVIEIIEDVLLYITFLSTAWLLRRNGHVTMDIVVLLVKPRIQRVLITANSLLCSLACLILTIYGAKATLASYLLGYKTATELELPQFVIILIVPLGTFLLFVQFIRRAYEPWKRKTNGVK